MPVPVRGGPVVWGGAGRVVPVAVAVRPRRPLEDVGEDVEDGPHGAHEVELDDGAPEHAFFAEGRWCIETLEFWRDGLAGVL